MVYYHEEHIDALEQGRPVPAFRKQEIDEHWRRSYSELKKATAVGAFLISTEADAALRKMWREQDKGVDSADFYGSVESRYIAARDCLKAVVEAAQTELNPHRRG